MSLHNTIQRLQEHGKVIRDTGWNGAADAMTDAIAELAAAREALTSVAIMLNTELKGHEEEPLVQRVRALLK